MPRAGRGCKNRTDLVPGQTSYKATKPGSSLLCLFGVLLFLGVRHWCMSGFVVTAHSELRKVLFLALSVTFFVCVSLEPLNGFATHSHGRRVWSLDRGSLKVKVKCQGHQRQKQHFRPFRRPACSLCLVKHI